MHTPVFLSGLRMASPVGGIYPAHTVEMGVNRAKDSLTCYKVLERGNEKGARNAPLRYSSSGPGVGVDGVDTEGSCGSDG